MMIFIDSCYVVPLSRIYSIKIVGSKIMIQFESGDFSEFESKLYRQSTNLIVHYDSSNDAVNVLRQFYKACKDNSNVFSFKSSINEKKN